MTTTSNRRQGRRWVGEAAALCLTTAGLGLAMAQPAAAAPTISKVTVAWADSNHSQVHITWADSTKETVFVATRDMSDPTQLHCEGVALTDGAADYDLSAGDTYFFPKNRVMQVVVAPGECHNPQSFDSATMAFSPSFDTIAPPTPTITKLANQSNNGALVDIVHGTMASDTTPGDPLDESPAPQVTYRMWDTALDIEDWQPNGPVTTGTQVVLGGGGLARRAAVAANGDWGPVFSKMITLNNSKLTTQATSGRVPYGSAIAISGTLQEGVMACDYGPCWTEFVAPTNGSTGVSRTVVLQARNSATGSWYTVGSTQTVASTGAFTLSPSAGYTREFRIVAPNTTRLNQPAVVFGTSTPSFTKTVVAKVQTAKFVDRTASYGQKVTAQIQVSPTSIARATLQRWNGSSWVSVKYVSLSSGKGSYTFTANIRGTTSWRFWVDGVTSGDHRIAPTTSPTFTLYTS